MMKLDQYKKICKISNSLLKEFQNSLNILSINELHVVRPHPVFLKNYYVLFENFFYIKILLIFIKNLSKILASISYNFFLKKNKFSNLEEYKYVFFFTSFFNLNQINTHTSKDVYYSHICKNLDPRDYCIIYLNHVDKNFLKKENKIFLDRSLSFYKEIKIFSELLFDTFKLFKKGLFERNIFKKKFYLFISINCISVSTLF